MKNIYLSIAIGTVVLIAFVFFCGVFYESTFSPKYWGSITKGVVIGMWSLVMFIAVIIAMVILGEKYNSKK